MNKHLERLWWGLIVTGTIAAPVGVAWVLARFWGVLVVRYAGCGIVVVGVSYLFGCILTSGGGGEA